MPDFYHGSGVVFSTPDPDLIANRSSYGTNEYGWGFYASDSGGDAWEYLHSGEHGKEGIIYRIHVPDDTFANSWIKSNQPIGQAIYDRLMKAAQSDPRYLPDLKGITPNSLGEKVAGIAVYSPSASPKEGAAFLARAGIQGYKEGAYAVFYEPGKVNLEPYQGYGMKNQKIVQDWEEGDHTVLDSPKANDAKPATPIEPQATTPAPLPLNKIGQAFVDNGAIASEVLARAARLLKMNHPELLAKLAPILQRLHTGPYSQNAPLNGGFDAREKFGYAIERGLSGEEFGTTPANLGATLRRLGLQNADPKLYDDMMSFMEKDLAPHMKGAFAQLGFLGRLEKAAKGTVRNLTILGHASQILDLAAEISANKPKMEAFADELVQRGLLTPEAADYYKQEVIVPALTEKSLYNGMGGINSPKLFDNLRTRFHVPPDSLKELDPTGGILSGVLSQETASINVTPHHGDHGAIKKLPPIVLADAKPKNKQPKEDVEKIPSLTV